ncbi:hypothetical protein HMPREF9123_1830 [Neisseria bacilliformis ATCC BAA-1200]|uniref:Uncharacterized protein n=1 Tax=Neisseria bacilliformis ATCC BAA-1200 TaxID=888742 RepID=F2BDM4_9NEIS|nr:hypothetical protein HMPREF9123_1830 [Neisseria bacilliformis ATCC BAA-1200]
MNTHYQLSRPSENITAGVFRNVISVQAGTASAFIRGRDRR